MKVSGLSQSDVKIGKRFIPPGDTQEYEIVIINRKLESGRPVTIDSEPLNFEAKPTSGRSQRRQLFSFTKEGSS
jgi:hypothetical protein